MRTVVCVLKTGEFHHPLGKEMRAKYAPAHVQALQTQVAQYCQGSDFICLSNETVPGVQVIPLVHHWPGWWSKIELFRHDFGPTLYLDLDMILRGDLTIMMRDAHTFTAWSGKEGRMNSSVMAWDAPKRHIYESFAMQADEVMHRMVKKSCLGDQCFIQKSLPTWEKFADRYPGFIVNYQELNGKPPPDSARIVCFKGKTKPEKAKASWIK